VVQRGRWAGRRAAPAACHRAYSLARCTRPRSSSAARFLDNGRVGAFITRARCRGQGGSYVWSPCCRWDNSFSILQPAHVRSFTCRLSPWFLVRPSEPLTSVLL
jgi:hypothetical protein